MTFFKRFIFICCHVTFFFSKLLKFSQRKPRREAIFELFLRVSEKRKNKVGRISVLSKTDRWDYYRSTKRAIFNSLVGQTPLPLSQYLRQKSIIACESFGRKLKY